MIDERLEEQASLYVLGILSGDEIRDFEARVQRDGEVRDLVAALQAAATAFAGTAPLARPSPELRQRILAEIGHDRKIIPLRPANRALSARTAWAIAACLAVLCMVFAERWNSAYLDGFDKKATIATLNQLATTLQNETNQLQQLVTNLRETNHLAGLRIAMLNSLLADAPKAVAVSLWDEEKQTGVFLVQNLKVLPSDKDYQLWVLDPTQASPVSAGVFQVDEKGNVRLEFKAAQHIRTAGKFAVTAEPKGGSPSPHLDQMVLAGG